MCVSSWCNLLHYDKLQIQTSHLSFAMKRNNFWLWRTHTFTQIWTIIHRKSSQLYSVWWYPITQSKLATALWNSTISCNYENRGTCITEAIFHLWNWIRTYTIVVTYIRTVTMSCKLMQRRNTIPLIKWLSSKQKFFPFLLHVRP